MLTSILCLPVDTLISYSYTLPVSYLIDHRSLLLRRKLFCSENIMVKMFSVVKYNSFISIGSKHRLVTDSVSLRKLHGKLFSWSVFHIIIIIIQNL